MNLKHSPHLKIEQELSDEPFFKPLCISGRKGSRIGGGQTIMKTKISVFSTRLE